MHLVRANKGHDFPPYDLVVVNPRECSGDYYLMSSAGLVHVCHGEPSEFTPLSEWMRQSTMFNMLQSIRFFKCYLHSKCFKLWRDNVRYKLFCQQRRKLSHRLFLAKDSFAGPYVELRRHMIDMQVHTELLSYVKGTVGGIISEFLHHRTCVLMSLGARASSTQLLLSCFM